MKFNWGHGIFIFIVIFMVGFGYVFIRSIDKGYHHELVKTNYYEDELKYQDVIDQKQNAVDDHKSIQFSNHENGVLLTFADSGVKVGQIDLMRNSNKDLDKTIKFKAKESYVIPKGLAIPGNYTVKVIWEQEGKSYRIERDYTF